MTLPCDPQLPSNEAIEGVLLAEPFDDPEPDPELPTDVDHYLYGAPRRSRWLKRAG